MKRPFALLLATLALLGLGLALWLRPARSLVEDLASEDPERVVEAARQLYVDSVNGIDHGPDLVQALQHPSPRVRARVLRTRARLNLNGRADAVVPLLRDPEESVRIQAAVALRELRGYRDPGALVAVFRDRAQPERVRVDVAWSLAERGWRAALPEFLAVAGDRSEPVRVRMEAVRGLAGLRAREQTPFLAGLVLDEGLELRLRRTAMQALGKLPSPEARALAVRLVEDRAQPPKLRADAARSLGCHGDPANVPILQGYLAPAQDLLVRIAAAQGLRELRVPVPGAAALVAEGLASPDPGTRSETACLAREMAEAEVLAAVKAAAARERDGKVRCDLDNAVCHLEGLLKTGSPEAPEPDPDNALAP